MSKRQTLWLNSAIVVAAAVFIGTMAYSCTAHAGQRFTTTAERQQFVDAAAHMFGIRAVCGPGAASNEMLGSLVLILADEGNMSNREATDRLIALGRIQARIWIETDEVEAVCDNAEYGSR